MGLVVYIDSNDGSGVGRLRMYNSAGERFDAIYQWNEKKRMELLSVHPVGNPLQKLCTYLVGTRYWPEEHLAAVLKRALLPGYEPGTIDLIGVTFIDHFAFSEKCITAVRNNPEQYGVENLSHDEIPGTCAAEVLEDGRLRLYRQFPKGTIDHIVDAGHWDWRDNSARLNA